MSGGALLVGGSPPQSGPSRRAILIAALCLLVGLGLVLWGWRATGYLQAVLLQLGSTVGLLAPLVVIQRILNEELRKTNEELRKTVDETQDMLAETLADTESARVQAPAPSADADSSKAGTVAAYKDKFLDALQKSGLEYEDCGSGAVYKLKQGDVLLIPMAYRTPIPSSAVQGVLDMRSVAQKMVVVGDGRLTGSARHLLDTHGNGLVRFLPWAPQEGPEALSRGLETAIR